MSNVANLLASISRRPLLIQPEAAEMLLHRLAISDPRGMESESRLRAILRKVGMGRGPARAMEDDDYVPEEPKRSCYSPLWATQAYGEPDDEGFGWSLFNGIALMQVNTALSDEGESYCGAWYHGYDTIQAALVEALGDSRVKGVFMRAKSPGGVVSSRIQELAAFMRAARGGDKPIHVYADLAASAMYWVGSQGSRFSAGPSGLVGSIGAVITHEDWSEAYAKWGVKITSIEFPIGKTDGAYWKALSDAGREDLDSEIRECAANFFADVHAARPQLTPEVLAGLGARVFMGQNRDQTRSALALGLIDAVETEQQAFHALLNTVSGSISAPRPSTSPLIAAEGSRGGAQTPENQPQEAQMADKKAILAELSALRSALAAIPAAAAASREPIEARLKALKAEAKDAGATDAEIEPDEDDQAGDKTKEPGCSDANATAKAILDLPEADGREKVAKRLAFTPGMTIENAKAILADTPKSASFVAAMGSVSQPDLGPSGGAPKVEVKPMSADQVYAARREACEKSRHRG